MGSLETILSSHTTLEEKVIAKNSIQEIKENIRLYNLKCNRIHNIKQRKAVVCEVGDQVLLTNRFKDPNSPHKLEARYTGPYKILRVNDNTVALDLPTNNSEKVTLAMKNYYYRTAIPNRTHKENLTQDPEN
jgi:hypothetical protein